MLGVHQTPGGEVRIRIRVTAYDYTNHPSVDQIEAYMHEKGFVHDPEIPGLFHNPLQNLTVADAAKKNFVTTQNGRLQPVDLMIGRGRGK
jgi:hypothetical protein